MKKQLLIALTVLAFACLGPPAAAPGSQAGDPTLVKTRIHFWPYTLTSYQRKHNDVWQTVKGPKRVRKHTRS